MISLPGWFNINEEIINSSRRWHWWCAKRNKRHKSWNTDHGISRRETKRGTISELELLSLESLRHVTLALDCILDVQTVYHSFVQSLNNNYNSFSFEADFAPQCLIHYYGTSFVTSYECDDTLRHNRFYTHVVQVGSIPDFEICTFVQKFIQSISSFFSHFILILRPKPMIVDIFDFLDMRALFLMNLSTPFLPRSIHVVACFRSDLQPGVRTLFPQPSESLDTGSVDLLF